MPHYKICKDCVHFRPDSNGGCLLPAGCVNGNAFEPDAEFKPVVDDNDYVDPATLTTLHALAGVSGHYQTYNMIDRDKFYAKRLWSDKKDMVRRLTGIKKFDPDDDSHVKQLSNIYTTPEQFIEKYKDRVNWNKISQNIRVVRNTIYDYVDPATIDSLH